MSSTAWTPGRADIADKLSTGELQKITGQNADGTGLLDQAETTHESAKSLQHVDPRSAITLAYDAGRLACEALLAHQGLRARSTDGHHTIVISAVNAQFGAGFSAMRSLKRRRHELEYPSGSVDAADDAEAAEAIEQTEVLLDAAKRLMPSLGIWN